MLVALDYDNTFTADPKFWTGFINLVTTSGHSVICVSGRRETFDNRKELESAMPDVAIYLSYDMPKRAFLKSKNVFPDVWIDDYPEMIGGRL